MISITVIDIKETYNYTAATLDDIDDSDHRRDCMLLEAGGGDENGSVVHWYSSIASVGYAYSNTGKSRNYVLYKHYAAGEQQP